MPSGLYVAGVEAFMEGRINLALDVVKVLLVDGDRYTPFLDADQFLDSIPLAAEVAPAQDLTGRTVKAGVFDAEDTVFPSVSGGEDAEFVVLYKESFSREASRLIAIFDAHPVVEAEGDAATVVWPAGGIFSF